MNSSTACTLPLSGVRVLDLSRLLPGPLCSLILADFGADVIKIEDTATGDHVRWVSSAYADVGKSVASPAFVALNRNKRSVQLNLKDRAGRAAMLRLVDGAQVVLESFRPGVLERLGLGYDVLRDRNPGIVYCGISGYGRSGPLAQHAGHDLNYLARAGVLALSGEKDGPPVQLPGPIGDTLSASYAAFAIVIAVRQAERTGAGQAVDIAIADSALTILAADVAESYADQRILRRGDLLLAGSSVAYRPYRCVDGWVTIGALEVKFWRAWCEGVGRPDLISAHRAGPGSPEHADIVRIFASRTRDEWVAFAETYDCCLEPVLEIDEALQDEQFGHRKLLVDAHLSGHAEPVRVLGTPIKLSSTPADLQRRPVPRLGEHTRQVLRAAGLDDLEIDALLSSGAAASFVDGARQKEPEWT
jgi:crotonobetainyl-CoA:carnitine CoA-transferase CaiB-like acyl-CoA transferase